MQTTVKIPKTTAKGCAINDMVASGENIQPLIKEKELKEFLTIGRQY